MKYHLTTALILGLAASASAALYEDFQFRDDAGTQLSDTTNTGTDGGASWNGNIADSGTTQGAVDNAGNFVVGYNAAAGSAAITKDYSKKVVLGTALTSGSFVFEYRLDSWDLEATATANGTAENNQGITFKLKDNNGKTVNLLSAITKKNDKFKARHSSNNPITATAKQKTFDLAGSDLVVRVEGNLDTGAFTTSYNYAGGGFTDLITDGAGLTSIKEIVLSVEGDADGNASTATNPWESNDFIAIDYVTLDVVPEPSSTALLGLGAIALLFRRKK